MVLGEKGKSVIDFFDKIFYVFFKIIGYIMCVVLIGVFGVMVYMIGYFGFDFIKFLVSLMMFVYIMMFLFVFVVLNFICKFYGFSLWNYFCFIKDEFLIVFGISLLELVFL